MIVQAAERLFSSLFSPVATLSLTRLLYGRG